MKTIPIPYHLSHMDLRVEEKNLRAVLTPAARQERFAEEADLVREALEHPIGTPRLRDLARGKKRVVIVTSDHTRSLPSSMTLPLLLGEIREGEPAAEITILIATGMHRAPTEQEQRKMFGDQLVEHETIVANDAFDPDAFTRVCELPSGAQFFCNSLAVNCDLLVCEGFIEPHFFAGFSGGRKSILPGVSNSVTIRENHSFGAIADPCSVTGRLDGNSIHRDMVCAARAVNVQFILNVALNEQKRVIGAWAGDLEQAHEEGVRFVLSRCRCRAVQGDIVVTGNGGYPLDQNLYQSVKGVDTAAACAGSDGVIIMCCSCCDGVGGEQFEKIMTGGTPEQIENGLSAIPPKETLAEQWNAQIYVRALRRHPVILVSTWLDADTVRRANMIPATDVNEALQIAYGIKGADASVVVIPDGVAVLPE